jgi:hypothetical protein
MTEDSPLQNLECNHCGSPIRTTAAPGSTVTCDCCGSAYRIPDSRKPAQEQVNIGTVIDGTISGDAVLGNKIVAGGSAIIVDKGASAKIPPAWPDSDSPAAEPGDSQ